MKTTIAIAAVLLVSAALADDAEESAFSFNAGADLRIRQEIMDNVPQSVNGYIGSRNSGRARTKYKNHLRYRPRVWSELKMGESWRVYARLADEFRSGVPDSRAVHRNTFPGEVVLDNLYIEGKGLFDDFLDIRAGRQDLYRMYGLDHIFVDGTPGDGSRTLYTDMVNLALHVNEDSWIDLFALYNRDRNRFRWGTRRSRNTSISGFGGDPSPDMDDWGFGAIWNSRIEAVDYKLFWIQKDTSSFHDRAGAKHARKQTNLIGTKIVPHWTENFSTPVELMGQVGQNGRGESLYGWMAYAGFDWKDDAEKSIRPFVNGGVMFQSGDSKNSRDEDGGHHAWDPMWYRGTDDSEMFLYGSLYGAGWWSNQINLKTSAGLIFSPRHKVQLMLSPMFAQERDGIGGGDGFFKGMLTQVRYDFPILPADKESGRRFEIFGHAIVELFNPGDYFDTDKPAYFFRWQIDFKF